MGSVYRGDRYDDSRTSVSSARREGYTTVKRYIVKEDDRDSRSSVGRARSFVPERAGERVEETRIIHREHEVEEPVREVRREEPRLQERELVIRRDESPPRARSVVYDTRREEPVQQERELVIRHTTEREEPRRDDFEVTRFDDRKVVETRYRDDYEVLSPRGYDDRDRDVQRYSRTTDYFAPAPPPQTIIIRQEPIIIRERPRDDDYQIVRKSDIDEERSIVRSRAPPPRSPRGEEDFYYEKKVRERIDSRRDDDDYYERRTRRRSVSPHDSVSQRGRDYSSDDSMVYVRKETTREESPSPERKRGLAAGVLAGVGAAELLRNHKRKEGQDVAHGVGRVGRDLGAGALGALAAEGIHRARSMHRSRSRRRHSRSRSDSRSRRRRSRSRSQSPSKLKTLGAVGLGAAALAAAATIASKRMNKNKEENDKRGRSRSRSRSRRRTESVSSLENDPDAPSDDARNPKHRRNTIAKVGAGGAVVAALIEHARSKSKARDGRQRSRSRIRQALPVIAAGLGSAAVAGVYEKHKAKKEAEEIVDKNRRARSRSRSRARSEHTAYYDGPPQPPTNEQAMVEYGNTPMYGNNYGPDYYGRPPPAEGYYSNAVVPAATGAAAGYGAQRGTRSRSRSLSRDRGGRRDRSSSSSADRGGRRSSRDAAKMAAAAGAGAAGASDYERRKQERRDRRARRRQQEEGYGRDPYEDNYNPGGGQYAPTPPQTGDPYATQQGFYPQTSQFPPPPGAVPQQYPPQAGPGMAAPVPGAAPYAQQGYPPPPPPPGAPPPPVQPYDAYASGANPYAPRGPENVSAAPSPVFGNPFAPTAPINAQNHVPDGLNQSAPVPPPPFPPVLPIPHETPYPPPPPPPPHSYEPPIPEPLPLSNPPPQETQPPPATRDVSPPRSQSQPPSSGRKSVQFAAKPEFSDGAHLESEASSPELQRRNHKHSHSRGYEAGDDTDSTPDELRRGNRDSSSRPLHPESADPDRRKHRRRRSHEPPSSRGEPSSRSRKPELERVDSPDSDATVDLPARFDDKGRKKSEQGDDPLADRLDEILSGKGAAGKVFGNFLDGLFGPDGRKKKGK